ncbi:sugar ABC transporter substrate-binding protein [Neobacillus mesonae]|uniref:Periplasmic binding protein domain-containing protein n=1 Tax=Neobacillus mesonae TaxID=1193713 RepID=A0A3Q9QTB3_9BACI|nr:sugar ABC transporter substrate-binding protein [Neobacillus mesonae]AZU62739.1 hypothetical protein CHR53_16520 [Neobacillus mesonae]
MLKNKRSIWLIAAAFMVLIISFISSTAAHEKPRMVVVVKSLEIQYWNIVKAGAENAFEELGIDGKVMAPLKETAEEQIQLLETVYQQNPDVVMVAPIDKSVIPILNKFTNNHIPVILVDQNEPWPNKAAYVGADNIELGKMAGTLMSAQLHPGNKVAIIGGDMSSLVFRERVNGAKMALKDAGIIVAAEKTGVPDVEEIVRTEILNILKSNPDIKGVITDHDLTAIPVIKELQDQNITIPVIGTDGISDMAKLIEDGVISSSIGQNPYDMGHLSVETALKVINGKPVDQFVDCGVEVIFKETAKERLDFYKEILK